MSNYSTKALTREEALKLKALGESYDITPMSIKEAIIAGAPNSQPEPDPEPGPKSVEKTLVKSSKKSTDKGLEFFDKALTNDERLDFYRNSNSGSGGSGEITDFFKTINVELFLSDALTAYMAQEFIGYLEVQVGAPSLVFIDQPEPDPDSPVIKSAEGINCVLLPMTEVLQIDPSGASHIIRCICPIGGATTIMIPKMYQTLYTFVEASDSVVMEYTSLDNGYVAANGNCWITIGLPSELEPDEPDEPVTPQL